MIEVYAMLFCAEAEIATQGSERSLYLHRVLGKLEVGLHSFSVFSAQRAWCWRHIASALHEGDPLHRRLNSAAELHLVASLPHLSDDYMGEHWLATFALLALDEWAA